MKKDKTNYYKTYNDDFVKTKNQNYELPDNYKWVNTNIVYRLYSAILFRIMYIFGDIYCKFVLHVKIENSKILKKYKNSGYFLYGNHTQPVGDVFIPAMVSKKRIYVIASTSNFGIPVIGKILPMIGILPIPKTTDKMKKLIQAVQTRIDEEKCVVIYPEAHVWPYYTNIRPYSNTSFKFPTDTKSPCFSITTTYYKRKFGKKPGIKVFVDGPFMPDSKLDKKTQQQDIYNKIYECMKHRSKYNNCEYIKYKEEK